MATEKKKYAFYTSSQLMEKIEQLYKQDGIH